MIDLNVSNFRNCIGLGIDVNSFQKLSFTQEKISTDHNTLKNLNKCRCRCKCKCRVWKSVVGPMQFQKVDGWATGASGCTRRIKKLRGSTQHKLLSSNSKGTWPKFTAPLMTINAYNCLYQLTTQFQQGRLTLHPKRKTKTFGVRS